jgi:hypothetical protein
MKKILLSFFLLFITFPTSFWEKNILITPIISVNNFVWVGKVFDITATDSLISSKLTATYNWIFEEWISRRVWKKVKHIFQKIWKKTITLSIKQWSQKQTVKKNIFIFNKKAVLITDRNWNDEILKKIVNQAGINWIWLNILDVNKKNTFSWKKDLIKNSEIIIFESENHKWIDKFSHFLLNFSDKNILKLSEKKIIKISSKSLNFDKYILYNYLDIFWVEKILIARIEALNSIFSIKEYEKIKKELELRIIQFTEAQYWWWASFYLPFSNLVEKLILKWVSLEVIFSILSIPFIVLLFIFFRNIIWTQTFWIHIPIFFTLAFLLIGIKISLLTLFFMTFISLIVFYWIKKLDLPFIPKNWIGMSIIWIFFLIFIFILLYFDFFIKNVDILLFLTITNLLFVDKIIFSFKSEWLNETLQTGFYTILFPVITCFILQISFIYNLILSFPEIIFLSIFLSFIAWKFLWLRIVEYFRFKNVNSDFREWNEEE